MATFVQGWERAAICTVRSNFQECGCHTESTPVQISTADRGQAVFLKCDCTNGGIGSRSLPHRHVLFTAFAAVWGVLSDVEGPL